MVIGVESINAEILLLMGVIFLGLGILFLTISILINKKLEKKQVKLENKGYKEKIKKPDLPFIEKLKNQEQIDLVTGKEIPKIIITRNNQEQIKEENIDSVEIKLEKEEPIIPTTQIIEIEQKKIKEENEEIKIEEEKQEEIELTEPEEELTQPEAPKEISEFIEIEDASQKEIQKTEPVILKPKEVTINTIKPEKGKEQEINLEDTEEEIELL